MMDFLSNPTNLAEVLAMLIALVTLTGRSMGWWRIFIFFLAITLAVEGAGYYMVHVLDRTDNYILFVLFLLVEVSFYTFIFFRALQSNLLQRWLVAFFILFILIYLYDISRTNFLQYTSLGRISLSVYVVLFSCIYYRQLLYDEKMFYPLRHPLFWIITGLFFFYFGTIVIFCFRGALLALPGHGIFIRKTLLGTLNWILYTCWSIAFIWKKRQPRSSRPS
jgi:hypothetical protein